MIARLALIALIAVGGGVSACAKLGELDQPPPLFGEKAKADYEAKKHQEDAERARAQAAREPESEKTPDTDLPLNAAPQPAPPVPGVNNPFGNPPPTSLPQPGTPNAQ
jgi:hypothetical protein